MHWFSVIQDLQLSEGADGSAIIKQWNNMSTKENQLTGTKRVGLLLMLSKMPESVQQVLLSNMSQEGPEGIIVGDDVLADKRVYPGHRYAASSPAWSDRMLVTEMSMTLMMVHLLHAYRSKPPQIRQKFNKDQVPDD